MTKMEMASQRQMHILGVGFAAIWLLFGCGNESRSVAPEEALPEVTVVTLKSTDVELTRELPGRTHAFLIAEVRPQASGIVKRRLFTEGQYVQTGQTLYELDDSGYRAEYESAQASLFKAQAKLHAAQLAARRSRQLAKANLVSAQDNETAIASESQALAEVGVAKADVARSRVDLGYTRVVAAISGRIGKSNVTEGALVTANQAEALAAIQQLDPIYVDFQAPEQTFAQIAVGQTVEVLTDTFAGQKFTGRIKFLDARVNTETRNFLVRAEIDNPDKKLLPGMFANVSVAAGSPRKVVVTPRTAVAYSLYGDSVYVLVPSAPPPGGAQGAPARTQAQGDQIYTVERRFVRVGEAQGDQVAINEGVKAGETVITEGQIKLQPGMRVRIDPKAGLAPMNPLPRL